mmetsp:Transcript_24852/g.40304  ORF Transcript_24852/g.40304 Transcript_24852/m.40304 type:complete len:178 (+) Transcript_24852:327-860(+)
MGFFKGGIFKFVVELPGNYPADGAQPVVTFTSKVFHPYIDPQTLVLDLSPRFKEWRASSDQLSSLLKYIKSIFYIKDPLSLPKNVANTTAAHLFETNQAEFRERAMRCVSHAKQRRFINHDKHSTLKFSEHNSSHSHVLEEILKAANSPSKTEQVDETDSDLNDSFVSASNTPIKSS